MAEKSEAPAATTLRIGTSGFGYREWLGKFYPPGLPSRQMLPYYAERFSTVEVNSSFYRMPSPSVLETWMSQVSSDFVFSFKAPGLITHRKRLRNVAEDTAAFLAAISVLGHNVGPVLFLLPANLRSDPALLEEFLDAIPHIRLAIEFRHPSWFDERVFDLLREHDCALCLSDRDEVAPPPVVATADFGYARLRRSVYSDEELREWSSRIGSVGWKEAFVYFRHEQSASGPEFARRMMAGAEMGG